MPNLGGNDAAIALGGVVDDREDHRDIALVADANVGRIHRSLNLSDAPDCT